MRYSSKYFSAEKCEYQRNMKIVNFRKIYFYINVMVNK